MVAADGPRVTASVLLAYTWWCLQQ